MSESGCIGLKILKTHWTPACCVKDVVEAVVQMFSAVEVNKYCFEGEAASLLEQGGEEFAKKAREWVKLYAQ